MSAISGPAECGPRPGCTIAARLTDTDMAESPTSYNLANYIRFLLFSP